MFLLIEALNTRTFPLLVGTEAIPRDTIMTFVHNHLGVCFFLELFLKVFCENEYLKRSNVLDDARWILLYYGETRVYCP